MSFLVLTEQGSTPASASASTIKLYTDNATIPRMAMVDDNGVFTRIGPPMYSIISASNFSLATGAGVQSCFESTGDVWTMPASTTFLFEGQYYITKTGAITTATAFAFSNAPTLIAYTVWAQNMAANTTNTATSITYVNQVASTVVTPSASANTLIKFSGIIRTNSATTITPQVNWSGTATTPVMTAGSYILFTPLHTSTTNVYGTVA